MQHYNRTAAVVSTYLSSYIFEEKKNIFFHCLLVKTFFSASTRPPSLLLAPTVRTAVDLVLGVSSGVHFFYGWLRLPAIGAAAAQQLHLPLQDQRILHLLLVCPYGNATDSHRNSNCCCSIHPRPVLGCSSGWSWRCSSIAAEYPSNFVQCSINTL